MRGFGRDNQENNNFNLGLTFGFLYGVLTGVTVYYSRNYNQFSEVNNASALTTLGFFTIANGLLGGAVAMDYLENRRRPSTAIVQAEGFDLIDMGITRDRQTRANVMM